MPLVDITKSEIEVRRWVGIWIYVFVEEDRLLECWVFQR